MRLFKILSVLLALGFMLIACTEDSDRAADEDIEQLQTCTRDWPLVQDGDSGSVTKAIQHLLNANGQNLATDGIFGPATEAGVEAFQSAKEGLSVDGIVGPNTWEELILTVSRGDEGDAVRAAQERLGTTVDGIFGPNTESATESFQAQQGLIDDGIVGPNTWAALVGSVDCEDPGDGGGGASEVCFPSGLCLPIATGQATGYKEAYWDAQQTGNPLLDTRGQRGEKVSANFTVGELTQSGGNTFAYARLDPDLVSCVQGIREALGQAVFVNSGYRSWAYNVELYENRGESPTLSRHTSGQAADIESSGVSGLDIAKTAIDQCGCNIGVGVGNTFAHIDTRGYYASWDYGGGLESAIDSYRAQRCN